MVNAKEISFTRRVLQVGFAVFFCLTTAGVIFGFAALKPVLISEGVYSSLCEPGEIPPPHEACRKQDLKLNLIFTIATTVTNASALPIGLILDRFGPFVTSLLGAVLFTLGNICFGLQIEGPGFDSYYAGYILIALGSPLIFIPCFHLSSAFPAYSGVVMSAITGAFDASSLPLVAFRAIYNNSNGTLKLRTWFFSYSILGVLVIIVQTLIGARSSYTKEDPATDVAHSPDSTRAEDAEVNERSRLLPPNAVPPQEGLSPSNFDLDLDLNASGFSRVYHGEDVKDDEGLKEVLKSDPLTGQLYGLTAGQQIASSWIILVTIFLCAHMLRINYYISTAYSQLLQYTHDPALAESLTTAFTYLLPLGGIIGIPFVGFLLDFRSNRDAIITLFVLGLVFGVLCLSSSSAAQIVGIAALTLLRPTMYTAVSDYTAKVVGFAKFGTVYGVVNTTSGLFGLIQGPLDLLVKGKLNRNYTPVNIALIIACSATSLALAMRIHLGTKSKYALP